LKLINRDTDYAIRALCFIAKHKGNIVSVKELVECLKIPQPFLRKILQILNKKRIVKSHKGKDGGFSLAVGADKLSLFNIVTASQGPVRLNDHTFKRKVCPCIKRCNVKKEFDRIEKNIVSELKAITVAAIIK